jgi:hypothetical protein
MSNLIVTGISPEEVAAETEDALTKIYAHIYDSGVQSGRENAGKDEIMEQVAEAAIGGLLDEGAPEHVREKIFANLIGFTQGWREVMLVEQLQFLTRFQSWRVSQLPRRIRIAWRSEYDRGLKRWRAKGGSLGGRPVLPEIP